MYEYEWLYRERINLKAYAGFFLSQVITFQRGLIEWAKSTFKGVVVVVVVTGDRQREKGAVYRYTETDNSLKEVFSLLLLPFLIAGYIATLGLTIMHSTVRIY